MKPLAEILSSFRPPVLAGKCPCGQPSAPGRECGECQVRRERWRAVSSKLAESLPEDHAESRFSAPDLAAKWVKPSGAIALAKGSVSSPRVVLVGASGTGKTTLAVCMAREWARAQLAAPLFVSCVVLVSARMRTNYGREASSVVEAIKAPLLILDDLGQPKSEPPSSPITDIIFARAYARRPTWVTTWMSPDDCTARYGDGVTRRVFERARIIKLEGSHV